MKETPYGAFGALLKAMRLRAQISQPDLAKQLGTTQQTISRWESGLHRPKADEMARLAAAVKVDAAVLLREAGYSNPKSAASFSEPFPVDSLTWEKFESFCAFFLQHLYPEAAVHQAGERGHKQDGYDIAVHLQGGTHFAFQCKRVREFGPADAISAIESYVGNAAQKYILLSRVASPRTRACVAEHGTGWDVWDKIDISRIIRSKLSPAEQLRLVDTFFRGQRMALLGVNDAGPWQTASEFFAPFENAQGPFNHTWPWIGKPQLAEELTRSLVEAKANVHIVVGPGGTGKTRLLKQIVEACKFKVPGLIIRFVGPGSDITSSSLVDLGPGSKILVIDDAHDRSDLDLLFQYIAVPENNVVVLLTSRPFGAGSIRGSAANYGLVDVFERNIELLSLEDSITLSRQALARFNGDVGFAESIGRKTLGCPLATIVGSYVVAKEKKHPEFMGNDAAFRNVIFGKFEKIIAGNIGTEAEAHAVKKVLKIIALVQPFEPDADYILTLVEIMENVPKVETRKIISLLLNSGILFKRGGRCRLCPDMLADIIIERECINSQDYSSSGYAESVFDKCNANQIKNLLFNMGKLEWRMNEGDPTSRTFLDSIWKKLKPVSNYSDPHIAAVRDVAYYQPARALKFVDSLIHQGLFLQQLPEIVKNAAFNLEHLKHACESLWELGRDDKRALHQNAHHAIRILSQLCEWSPYQRQEANIEVVDFALSLLKDPTSCTYAYTPFDILRGQFQTKVNRAFNTAQGFMLEQYEVQPAVVAPLRIKILDAVIPLLTSSDARMSLLTIGLLRDALRYPVSGAYHEEWAKLFELTLSKIEAAVKLQTPAPTTLIQLIQAISSHSRYQSEESIEIVKRISQCRPDALDFRTLQILVEGWDDYLYRTKDNVLRTEKKAWLDNLVLDLIAAYPEPGQLCEFLSYTLSRIEGVAETRSAKPQFFISMLLDELPLLARGIVEWAISRPGDLLSDFADIALAKLMRRDRDLGSSFAQKFLDSHSIRLKRFIGPAYWFSGMLSGDLCDADLKIIQTLLGNGDKEVVDSALIILRGLVLARTQTRLAIDLAKVVNLHLNGEFNDSLIDIFSTDDVVSEFTDDDAEHFLKALSSVQMLESYSLQSFLSNLSRYYPIRTAEFFMQRVVHASTNEDLLFLPCKIDSYDGVAPRFRETAEFPFLLAKLSQWIRSRDDSSFRRYATELFYFMFGPLSDDVLSFLSEWVSRAAAEDILVISQILSFVSRTFVITQSDFTIAFLQRASNFGSKTLENAVGSLYGAATSGVRGGPFGQPFPEDIEAKKGAEYVLSSLPRFSPSRPLYEMIYERAVGDIEQESRKAKFLEFEIDA